MNKKYTIKNIDCGHCAEKIESKINDLSSVNNCQINFLSQKITLDIDDDKVESAMVEINKIVKKVEPDCEIVVK